jgi:hypothetical protein
MVKRLEKEITSDCGNTFTSFGKLPSPVDLIVKPQVRKLEPKVKKIKKVFMNVESSEDDEMKQRLKFQETD